MADQNLTVKVAYDDGGMPGSVDHDSKALQALADAFTRSIAATEANTKAIKDNAGAHDSHEKSVKKHAQTTNIAAEGVIKLGEHYRQAGEGLSVFGLEAERSGVKLAALTDAIGALGAAAPAFIAIAAVVGIGAAAFDFLKDSVNEAAKSQQELATIGALVKNQGVADWKAQTDEVDRYASSLARTTTFGKSEWLESMQAMLTAGLSFNDTVRSQAAVMELAATKGISLRDAAAELSMAYDGNLIAIHRLGIVTSEEVKTGVAWETILTRIHDRLGGADAAQMDTYAGKVKNLGNLVALTKEEFGTALLPVLSAFEDAMRSGVSAMQPLSDEFKDWVQQHLPELKAGAQGFGDAFIAIAQRALPMVEQGVQVVMGKLAELGKAMGSDKDPIDGFIQGVKDVKKSFDDAKEAIDDFHRNVQPAVDGFNAIRKGAADSAIATLNWRNEMDATAAREYTPWLNAVAESWRNIGGAVKDSIDWLSRAGAAIDAANDKLTNQTLETKRRAYVQWSVEHGGTVDNANAAFNKLNGLAAPPDKAPFSLLQANDAAAVKYGLDPAVLRVLLEKESNYGKTLDARGRGDGGHGYGPYQLDDGRHPWQKGPGTDQALLDAVVADPLKAADTAAAKFSSDLAAAGGNLRIAYAMYNGGRHGWMGSDALAYADDAISKLGAGVGPTVAAAAQLHASQARTRRKLPITATAPKTKKSTKVVGGSQTDHGGHSAQIAPLKTDKVDEFAAMAKRLKEHLDEISRSEEAYAEKVALASDSDDRAAKTLELKKKAQSDALEMQNRLDGEIQTQIAAGPILKAQLDEENATRHRLHDTLQAQKDKLDDLKNAGAKGTVINALDSEIRKTERALARAEEAYGLTNRQITENTTRLEANRQAWHALTPKTYEYDAAIRALSASLADQRKQFKDDDATAGQSADTQAAYWRSKIAGAKSAAEATTDLLKAEKAEHDVATQDRAFADHKASKDQAIQDEIATYGLSLQAQYAYFSARLEGINRFDASYRADQTALYDKLQDIHKQFVEQWQSRETGWLDGLIKHTTSLKGTLKSIWSTIFDDLAKAWEQKFVTGAMGGKFNDALAKAFGIPTAFGMEAPTTGPQAATADALASKANAAVQARTVAEDRATTATNSVTTAFQDVTAAAHEAANALRSTGSGGGSGGGSILDSLFGGGKSNTGGGDLYGAVGKAGPSDPLTSLFGGGSDFLGGTKDVNITKVGGADIGSGGKALPTDLKSINGSSAAAGAMQGLMIAQLVTGITGGNQTWGSLGGAIGGAFGGPAGAAAGAAIGGLFGPHWGPASNYPDRSDPTYKAWLDAFNSGPGGGGDHVEKMVAAMDPKALSGQQLDDYNKLKGWEGGTGQLGIVSEKDGFFTLVSGMKVSVAEFRATVDRFATATAAYTTSSVFTLTRTYPDLNISNLSANGTYTPQPITVNPGGAGTGGNTGSGGSGGGGTTGGKGGGGNRNVNGPDDPPAGDLHVQLVMPNGDALANAVFPRILALTGRQNAGLVAATVRSRVGA